LKALRHTKEDIENDSLVTLTWHGRPAREESSAQADATLPELH
jgi:hypothetical protein